MAHMHRQTRYYLVGKVLTLLLAPLAVILLPGLLGEKGYARFGYWFSLISLYIVLLDLGTQALLRRYLPEMAVDSPRRGTTLFNYALKLKGGALIALLIAAFFSPDPKVTLALLGAALLASLATTLADVYYAFQQMGRHSVVVIARKLFRIIFVPAGFLLWGVSGILIGLVLAELIPFLMGMGATRNLPGPAEKLERSFRHYYVIGAASFIGFFAATLLGRSPVLFAEWSGLSLEQVGRVALAVDLTYFALKELLNGISESILPRLIEYKTRQQASETSELIAMNYRFVNFCTLLVIAVGIPLIPAFLPLLGSGFWQASVEVQLLVGAVLFGCWNNIHNQILFIHNRPYRIMIPQLVGLAVMLTGIAVAWQVGKLDIRALAALLAGSMVITSITSYLYSRRFFRHHSVLVRFVRLLPSAAITSSFILLWQPAGLLPTFFAAAAATIIYIVISFVSGGLTRDDFGHIRKTLMKK